MLHKNPRNFDYQWQGGQIIILSNNIQAVLTINREIQVKCLKRRLKIILLANQKIFRIKKMHLN